MGLTFRSRLSSPSVELTLSQSLVLEGLWRLFFTESWARVFSAFESRRSVSGTASFRSKKRMKQNNRQEKPLERIIKETTDTDNKNLKVINNSRQKIGDNHAGLSDNPTGNKEIKEDLGEMYKAQWKKPTPKVTKATKKSNIQRANMVLCGLPLTTFNLAALSPSQNSKSPFQRGKGKVTHRSMQALAEEKLFSG